MSILQRLYNALPALGAAISILGVAFGVFAYFVNSEHKATIAWVVVAALVPLSLRYAGRHAPAGYQGRAYVSSEDRPLPLNAADSTPAATPDCVLTPIWPRNVGVNLFDGAGF